MELAFERSTTAPPLRDKLDDRISNTFHLGVTEPSSKNTQADDISHRVMEDYPLLEEKQSAQAQLQSVQSIAMNLLLCAVNLLAGCFMPAVTDRSRTATVYGPSHDGKTIVAIDQRFPYSPATLIMSEAVANIAIGMIGMIFSARPWRSLLDLELHCNMFPLTLIYVIGDIAALGAIGSGGGLLYLTVVNSRLLFAALASTMIMKQRLECLQWGLLASITTCIVIFATGHVRSEDESSSGATVALLLALLKSFLSALAAVLTETRYKNRNIWEASTLLKMQSFVVAVLLTQVRSEPLQLCPQPLTLTSLPSGRCMDRHGWDRWTWTVLLAEVSNGWLSLAILTRLSAIAKFVCKAACAPSLYVAYCFLGWNQFKPQLFASVLIMTISIVLYAKESIELLLRFVRLRLGCAAPEKKSESHLWTAGYSKPGKPRRLEGVKEAP